MLRVRGVERLASVVALPLFNTVYSVVNILTFSLLKLLLAIVETPATYILKQINTKSLRGKDVAQVFKLNLLHLHDESIKSNTCVALVYIRNKSAEYTATPDHGFCSDTNPISTAISALGAQKP